MTGAHSEDVERVASRAAVSEPSATGTVVSASSEHCRLSFHYRVSGDIRFISHHDTIRMFRRAFARAVLPVRFTEGFNPHPRISIPVPRPVGVASEDECIVLELEGTCSVEEASRAVAEQLPAGMELTRAALLEPGERRRPAAVRYRLDQVIDTTAVGERIAALNFADEIPIIRKHHKTGRVSTYDLKPRLIQMEIRQEGLEFTLAMLDSGSARPSEVLGVLGFDPEAHSHRLRRMEITWQ